MENGQEVYQPEETRRNGILHRYFKFRTKISRVQFRFGFPFFELAHISQQVTRLPAALFPTGQARAATSDETSPIIIKMQVCL